MAEASAEKVATLEPAAASNGRRRKDVAKAQENTAVALREPATLLSMLQTIITDPSVSIERVNQAFDFYQRMEQAEAKKAFDAAMADAKAEFEPIVKRHLVTYGTGDKATSYKHEDLADISEAVDPVLAKHGLNSRWRASSKLNEPITVTCIVTHKLGYSEETTLCAGADNSGGKNSIQGIGSTLTYLQRYTKKLALGLAAGRDNDGKDADAPDEEKIAPEQAQELEALAEKASIDLQIIYEHFNVTRVADLTPAQHKTALSKINKKLELSR